MTVQVPTTVHGAYGLAAGTVAGALTDVSAVMRHWNAGDTDSAKLYTVQLFARLSEANEALQTYDHNTFAALAAPTGKDQNHG